MKVKIVKSCVDRYTGKEYKKGDVLTVSDERGEEMIARKEFCEKVKEPAKRKPKA